MEEISRQETLAIAAGVPADELYDWTWGEMDDAIRGWQERRRLLMQDMSVIAYRHAGLVAGYVSGNIKSAEVYEVFPFWSEDEMEEMAKAAACQRMRSIAKRKVVSQ